MAVYGDAEDVLDHKFGEGGKEWAAFQVRQVSCLAAIPKQAPRALGTPNLDPRFAYGTPPRVSKRSRRR